MSRQLKYHHKNKVAKTKKGIDMVRSNKYFRTKSELKQYLLDTVKNTYGVIITPEHKEYDFFCDMIDRHYEIKVEEGMRFVVHTEQDYGLSPERTKSRTPYRRSEPHRCYVYRPSKQDWESFSLFVKCVNGRDDSEHTKKMKRYRESVAKQVKGQWLSKKWACEFCGSGKLLELDHHPTTFVEIVKNYEEQDEPGGISFESYHEKNATYRVLCQQCHRNISNNNNK